MVASVAATVTSRINAMTIAECLPIKINKETMTIISAAMTLLTKLLTDASTILPWW